MTMKADLRLACAQILRGATDAGQMVFTPGDWPTYTQEFPVIRVSSPHDEKTSYGPGTIEFLGVCTIRFLLQVETRAKTADAGSSLAEQLLERLEAQVLGLIIGHPVLMTQPPPNSGARISQFPSIRSEIRVTDEGERHLGSCQLDIEMEYYSGPEDFYGPDGAEIKSIQIAPNPAAPGSLQGPSPHLYVTP